MKKTLLILIVLLLLNLPTFAEDLQWQVIDGKSDIVVTIVWEKSTPNVIFVDPSGKAYHAVDSTKTYDDKIVFYKIEAPKAGAWSMRLDKKDNPFVEIAVQEYHENPVVEQLTIQAVENGSLPVSFTVTHKESLPVNLVVSAVTEVGGPEKVLYTGIANTNEVQSLRVDLSKLASYDPYLIQVKALFNIDGIDYFDTATSNPFSWTNTAKASMQDFELTIDETQHRVEVAWPNLDYDAERILVAIFEDQEKEPSTFFEFDPDEEVSLSYLEKTKHLRVELSLKKSGVYVSTLVKELSLDASNIQLEELAATNKNHLKMHYTNLSAIPVQVTVGEKTENMTLNGSGEYDIQLEDFDNEVVIEYTDKGITRKVTRTIFVDHIPPELVVETSDQISKGMIRFVGYLKDGNSVWINGVETPLQENGMFTAEIKQGEDMIIIAKDIAGNETQYIYDPKVAKEPSEEKSNLFSQINKWDIFSHFKTKHLMIIMGAFSVLLILYAAVFWKKHEEVKDDEDEKNRG